jgi:hypothetical protein
MKFKRAKASITAHQIQGTVEEVVSMEVVTGWAREAFKKMLWDRRVTRREWRLARGERLDAVGGFFYSS